MIRFCSFLYQNSWHVIFIQKAKKKLFQLVVPIFSLRYDRFSSVLIFPPFGASLQAAYPVSVFIPGWSTEEENFMYFCVLLISEKEKEVSSDIKKLRPGDSTPRGPTNLIKINIFNSLNLQIFYFDSTQSSHTDFYLDVC